MLIREPTTPGSYFVYNGFNSADYGVFISGVGIFPAPERIVDVITVPGRSGNIIFDNKRFENIDVTVPCYIPRRFQNRFADFKAAILSDTGYHRLEFSQDADHFREAYVTGPITPSTGPLNRSGQFDITFHCKPQRFLKLGERTIVLTGTGEITNPTLYHAKPLIQITGTQHGSFMLDFSGGAGSNESWNVIVNDNVTGIMYLDSYTGNAYYERTSGGTAYKIPINNKIQTQPSGFPQLRPGYNKIVVSNMSGTVTRMQVYPRWWTV